MTVPEASEGEARPSWTHAAAAALVFPALGPLGPVLLGAVPVAVMGLLSLGPGGVLYAAFLGTWWLPAFYALFGPPFLLAGLLYAALARLAGRPRLWLAALAAEFAFVAYFGAAGLLPGGVDSVAPTYMPLWDGVRRSPAFAVAIALSAVLPWWVLRLTSRRRARSAAAGGVARRARMPAAERLAALGLLAGTGLAWAALTTLVSRSPDLAWKDCSSSSYGERVDGCRAIAGRAGQPLERRVTAWTRLGDSLADTRRDDEEAIAAFSEAIRLDPAAARAYAGRALVLARRGEPARVVADVEAAFGLASADTFGTASRLYRARGQARLALGRPDLAIADHTEEARLTPRFADGFLHRAAAHLAQNDPASALADAEAAVRIEGFHARVYVMRARAHLAAGRKNDALADFSEAIRRMPGGVVTAPAYLGRAALLEERGDAAGARADYDKALELVPGNAAAAAGRDRLRVR